MIPNNAHHRERPLTVFLKQKLLFWATRQRQRTAEPNHKCTAVVKKTVSKSQIRKQIGVSVDLLHGKGHGHGVSEAQNVKAVPHKRD